MRTPRRLIGMSFAVAALAAIAPASASAALSLAGSNAQPSNLQAGAHSDFKVHVATTGDDLKDLVISSRPGRSAIPWRRRSAIRASSRTVRRTRRSAPSPAR